MKCFVMSYVFVSIIELFIVAIIPIAMINGYAYLGRAILLSAFALLMLITVKNTVLKTIKYQIIV